MWFIALLSLSVISTLLWYKTRSHNKYRFDILALISGSAATMFFVDAVYRYLNEGVFIEVTADSISLSLVLVLFVVIFWFTMLITRRPRF
ncbi:MAG: hypothetical protein QXF00_01115 [Desulfurococcaceae archaeon]